MITNFRPFDENGHMKHSGRACAAKRGVVASGRAEASEIGKEILAAGGNAVDAAVAVAFALGVCEPNACGIGGGGFFLIRSAKTGENVFLNFREKAPAAARPDMYERNPSWDPSKGWEGANYDKDLRNVYSAAAAAVPGDVAGLLYALEHYGTLDRRTVMAPAIALAREGFVVTPLLAADIALHAEQLKTYGDGWKIYLPDGRAPKAGDVLKNPDLADTLEAVAEGGRDVFYKGRIAEKILRQSEKDNGWLTAEDLQGFRVTPLQPVRGTYRGYEILSSPPPSSGGTHVVQILNVLENFDVGALAVNSPEYVHLFSEVFKMCYADRMRYMGDPDYVQVPLQGLLSKDYAKELAARVDLQHSRAPQCGRPNHYESTSTTHFSIADSEGNLVAATRTINHFFGSCAVPEGTGFLLNDEMEDFSIDPASPNAPAGGKVPLSCMSPTFLLKGGKPVAVLGSPGGIRIISSVVQVISKIVDHGMDLESAVNSPRFGDDIADCIICEDRVPPQTIEALQAMGHKVRLYPGWDRIMGAVNSAAFLPDGTLAGAADPRRDGLAVGI